MRYYTIQILNSDGTQAQLPSGQGPAVWTSFANGRTNLNAQQVELDIPVTTLAQPIGAASIKIWGVSLQTIGQASDFNGKLIKVYAGMQAGLPLANPAQSGLVLQGLIQQAFGNWVTTSQWVEFIVTTDGSTGLDQQQNIVLNWKKGATLSAAIQQTLAVAAPTFKTTINISDDLVLGQDEAGFYQTMLQFAQYVKTVSLSIKGVASGYQGVDVLVSEDTFTVFDGTSPTSPVKISFTDLIGQPTWIDPGTIQVTTVMRADLQPTDYITLPPTQVTIAPSQPLVPFDRSVFQGSFLINQMRHVGNFRQPDANAWVTTFNCSPSTPA